MKTQIKSENENILNEPLEVTSERTLNELLESLKGFNYNIPDYAWGGAVIFTKATEGGEIDQKIFLTAKEFKKINEAIEKKSIFLNKKDGSLAPQTLESSFDLLINGLNLSIDAIKQHVINKKFKSKLKDELEELCKELEELCKDKYELEELYTYKLELEELVRSLEGYDYNNPEYRTLENIKFAKKTTDESGLTTRKILILNEKEHLPLKLAIKEGFVSVDNQNGSLTFEQKFKNLEYYDFFRGVNNLKTLTELVKGLEFVDFDQRQYFKKNDDTYIIWQGVNEQTNELYTTTLPISGYYFLTQALEQEYIDKDGIDDCLFLRFKERENMNLPILLDIKEATVAEVLGDMDECTEIPVLGNEDY